jgi:hypothetical protein
MGIRPELALVAVKSKRSSKRRRMKKKKDLSCLKLSHLLTSTYGTCLWHRLIVRIKWEDIQIATRVFSNGLENGGELNGSDRIMKVSPEGQGTIRSLALAPGIVVSPSKNSTVVGTNRFVNDNCHSTASRGMKHVRSNQIRLMNLHFHRIDQIIYQESFKPLPHRKDFLRLPSSGIDAQ